MKLARALLALSIPETSSTTLGVVTATSPFTIRLNGDTVDIVSPSRYASYTPAVSDVVIVKRFGPTLIVVDKIA